MNPQKELLWGLWVIFSYTILVVPCYIIVEYHPKAQGKPQKVGNLIKDN